MNWFKRSESKRDVVDFNECLKPEALKNIIESFGYSNVWFEDTDMGLVIHGLSIGRDEGGDEVIVPEEWMNK